MRVMHVITRFIRGGAQENTLLTLRGQAAIWPGQVVLVTGPTTGPEGSLLPDVEKLGVPIIEIPTMLRAVSPLNDWRAYWALRKLIREWRPDVVHTHSSKAGVLGRMAASGERVKRIVHTIHGLPFHPYQGKLAHALYVMAEKTAARHCHHIVSVADAMTRQAVAAGVAPPDKFTTIYSGMEVERFLPDLAVRQSARAHFGFANGDLVIGKIARLFTLKGHDYLFEAFAGLTERFPNARLFLVGGGEWRERLERRAASLGFADRVVWAGLLHPDEVPAAIQAMDVVAHCSLREGLARVIPQGLLAGKPVVAFDVDGAREILERICPGWLVAPKDVVGLRQTLFAVLNGLPEAMAMATAKGTPFCRDNFAWQTMCARLESVYRGG